MVRAIVVGLLLSSAITANACDHCRRTGVRSCGTPMMVVPTAVYGTSSVPMTTTAVPMTWSTVSTTSVPMTMSVAPMSVAPVSVAPAFTPMSYAPMSYSPAYYSPMSFAPASYMTAGSTLSAADAQALQNAQAQGLFTDFLFGTGAGLVRGTACEVCRNLGCDSSGGSGSRDPVSDLRNTLKGITETIREIKNIEKEFKDAFKSTSIEEAPAADDEDDTSLAQLQNLRDELRQLNADSKSERLAADVK